jgi:hypothetical protein
MDSVPKMPNVGISCLCKLSDKGTCVSKVQAMTYLFTLIRKFVTNNF